LFAHVFLIMGCKYIFYVPAICTNCIFKRFLPFIKQMMNYIVTGSEAQWDMLRQCGSGKVQWMRAASVAAALEMPVDAFFYLEEDAAEQDFGSFGKPVFINCVTGFYKPVTSGVAGINGWPYFLQQQNWEIAGELTSETTAVLALLGKTITPVPAVPGFIAPRIIAAIINEAFFALEDGVSTREDIDTAMKMGTNYPYGPFEWAGLLGKANVCRLLQQLAATDMRYSPAPILQNEARL
jgi:3-hydroxybutyryl-CoA dehydrogenase